VFDTKTIADLARQYGLTPAEVTAIADDVLAKGDAVSNPNGLLHAWCRKRSVGLASGAATPQPAASASHSRPKGTDWGPHADPAVAHRELARIREILR
jgi:hypothetical protein